MPSQKNNNGTKSKKGIIIAIAAAIVAVIAIVCAVLFLGNKEDKNTETEPVNTSKTAVVEDMI